MAGSSYEQLEKDYGKLSLGNPTVERKKKLLVIGLGGILCHRINWKDTTAVPVSRLSDAAYGSYRVYKRPYCDDFLRFCLEWFEVGIWASAREWYMNNALDCMTGNLRSKLLFAWDQSYCTNTGFSSQENKKKPILLKELRKVWDRFGQFSSSNTLLIDDDSYKALLNPPNTAIFPTEYKAHYENDDVLAQNSDLRRFLSGLDEAADVPSYVKDHPYGQPAMTPQHSDWEFFSKVLRSVRGYRTSNFSVASGD